ncbi:MAG: translation initiation factor IF-2 [Clostridiales bacterium]|nr:translation initiation factor IF-2 [Clostridiales bacterium]
MLCVCGGTSQATGFGSANSAGFPYYTNRNNDENRNYGSRSDGSRNSDTRYNNRNNDSGRNYNSRSNDGSRSYSSRNSDDNRSYNRGDSSRSDGGRGNDTGRKTRSKSMTSGDTPINAKESRSGNSRHDINREHSRENQNRGGENRDSRGGKNTRRNNNNTSRNNDYNNNNNQKRTKNKTKQTIVKTPKKEEPKEEVIRNITLPNPVSLKDLAEACKVTPAVIIKKLFLAGQMVTINTEFGFDEAADIALEYNCIAEEEVQVDIIEELLKEEEEDESTLVGRPPVVCVMGHVDHGKTSLLDAIRSTHVTEGEAGGITQHIGAYVVNINDEKITFLDTPGHEAFTSMRLRGAQATDIAVLVVAADDRVMPQTIEAINHAKAAEVEVIVAVNKIDKEGANVERVKQELTEYGLIAEDWGGSTVFVPISAKTGEGIQDLLEMISLTAEVLELKANPKRKARGLVIEAKLDKGRGPVATVLIQKGTLHVGDNVNIGHTFGRIRAMIDDKGNRVKTAGPSMPVEILGLNDVPFSGEVMLALDSEMEARTTAEAFVAYSREKMLEDTKSKLSLDDLFDQIQAGNVKELNLVVKADVQGSVEAVRQSLMKLSNDEVVIKVIHGGVGAINESDVTLASASNAIIIGFNVRPDATAKSVAEREKVDMRLYRVIYNAIEDIEAAIKGMLDPVFQEKIIGHLDVRQIYKASGVGTIAGCYVLDGMITRSAQVRIVRDGIVIYEGLLASLKRFKDDVKEVKSGFECGLVFEKFNDVKEGDQVEAFVMEEIPR